ncbi:hypothetical protein LXA43DRAFT_167875 [Ganoderma leucocontextum]|nr:hypothetical protein LXA43DRAFT_167875 [Ganoderma leucocontextum]
MLSFILYKPHGSNPPTTTNASDSFLISAARYAAWHADDFPPAIVSWDKYTHLTYSFASVLTFTAYSQDSSAMCAPPHSTTFPPAASLLRT